MAALSFFVFISGGFNDIIEIVFWAMQDTIKKRLVLFVRTIASSLKNLSLYINISMDCIHAFIVCVNRQDVNSQNNQAQRR